MSSRATRSPRRSAPSGSILRPVAASAQLQQDGHAGVKVREKKIPAAFLDDLYVITAPQRGAGELPSGGKRGLITLPGISAWMSGGGTNRLRNAVSSPWAVAAQAEPLAPKLLRTPGSVPDLQSTCLLLLFDRTSCAM